MPKRLLASNQALVDPIALIDTDKHTRPDNKNGPGTCPEAVISSGSPFRDL